MRKYRLAISITIGIMYIIVFIIWINQRTETGFLDKFVNVKADKYVALTFDDGPKQGATDVLLEGLKERSAKATFFVIGVQIEENKDIIKKMFDEGHQIGNHTYGHKRITLLSEAEQKEQLNQWFDEISKVIPIKEYLVRPPFGEMDSNFESWVEGPIVLWSVDTNDWTGKSAGDIANYVVKEARDGDIILMHDIFQESVKGALMAIDRLQEEGFHFVTVDELFEIKEIPLEKGNIYKNAY